MSQIITAAPLNTVAPDNADIKLARGWQRLAVPRAVASRYFLLVAPGGSGKSLAQCMAGAIDIEACGNKQLILVPQQHIHHGFYGSQSMAFRLSHHDKVRQWTVAHNFCVGKKIKSEGLKNFLLADAGSLYCQGGSVAIATHSAMARLWGLLSNSEKERAVRNITFRIDEAHHISGVFEDAAFDHLNKEEQLCLLHTYTRLGSLCRYCINTQSSTTKLHLSTATFFRGDRKTILSESIRKQFEVFEVSWSDYFSGLNLNNFLFDFITYKQHPIDLICEAIRQEQEHRHLIILPGKNRRFRTEATLPQMLTALEEIYPASQLLDLVTEKTQKINKARLLANPEQFNAIIACRLFDEGTDWVLCDRMHNADACEKSLTLAVQRFFRPFRYHPQKKTVRIFNYLPEFTEAMNAEDKRRVLSDRFNALMASIVTSGELVPCLIPLRGSGDGRQNQPERGKSSQELSLQEVYGHKQYIEVVADLIRRFEQLETKDEPSAIIEIIEKVIDTHQVPDGVRRGDIRTALEEQIIRIANPKARQIRPQDLTDMGFDVGAIARNGFDKVWKKQGQFQSTLLFGTENISPAVIRELINIVAKPLTLHEIHEGIKSFYSRTGQRLTFKTGWIDELDTTSGAVEKCLRRHHNSTLSKEVDKALGDPNDSLVQRTRQLIASYASRGIRLTRKCKFITELGLTGRALDARLLNHYGTSLGDEVQRVLGAPLAPEISIDKIREVIRSYHKKGIKLSRKFGLIPELSITSYAVHDRLMRKYKRGLTDLVNETLNIRKEVGLPLIREIIRSYLARGVLITRSTGLIPELSLTANALNLRLKKYGTTLATEVASLRNR